MVLDISMPGIDGLEVVERLRRDGVDTPVVFLTAAMRRRNGFGVCTSAATTTSRSRSAWMSCWLGSRRFSDGCRRADRWQRADRG